MKKFPCDSSSVYLITDRLTRNYLSGLDVAEGFLLLYDGGAICLTDARYYSAAKPLFESAGIKALLYKGFETLEEVVKSLNKSTLFLDFSRETIKDYNLYKSFNLEIKDCAGILERMRSVKKEEEILLIKTACDIAQKAYYAGISQVKEGISEIELKNIIEKKIIEFGGDGASFDIIVAFGENGAVPHHVTGQTKLKKDTSILIDMGAIVNGYMSDITRTAFFGKPSQKFVDCYNEVLKANELAESKIVAGMTTDKADAIAREHLKEKGLDKYFTHSLGHGVGLEIHEFPALSPRKREELKENMVFTIEPGVYFDGEFGIRIEDTVVIKNGKVQRLFTDDTELMIL